MLIIAIGGFVLTQRAPSRPVFDNPIKEGFFETDVVSYFFTFDPFVAENFCAFS